MFWLVQTVVPIFIVCVLPIMVVWLLCRRVMVRDRLNAEIVMKAIENNPNINADEIVSALSKKPKDAVALLRLRLLRGCIFTFIGIGLLIFGVLDFCFDADEWALANETTFLALIFLAIGIAYLVVYRTTRRQLEKESEK